MVVGAHDKERRVRVAQHTVAAVCWWLHAAPTSKFHTALCSTYEESVIPSIPCSGAGSPLTPASLGVA